MLIEKMNVNNGDLVVSDKLIGERAAEEPRVRISSLGNDLQKQYFDITLKEEDKEEITEQKQRVFSLGHILEQEIFRQLQGVIHDKDKIVRTGIADHRGEEIKGEIDCLFTDDHGITYVVDVKTMSDNSFKKLVEHQNIKESHYIYYVQLQMYMYFLDIDDGMILAYNKNNSEMAEVFCTLDRDFVDKQLQRINKLIWHLNQKEAPMLEYPNITYYKTQKVRNRDEYKGLGQIITEPHKLNRFNPYIDTERKVIDDPQSIGAIFQERQPRAEIN